jgi:hypothetical protein
MQRANPPRQPARRGRLTASGHIKPDGLLRHRPDTTHGLHDRRAISTAIASSAEQGRCRRKPCYTNHIISEFRQRFPRTINQGNLEPQSKSRRGATPAGWQSRLLLLSLASPEHPVALGLAACYDYDDSEARVHARLWLMCGLHTKCSRRHFSTVRPSADRPPALRPAPDALTPIPAR